MSGNGNGKHPRLNEQGKSIRKLELEIELARLRREGAAPGLINRQPQPLDNRCCNNQHQLHSLYHVQLCLQHTNRTTAFMGVGENVERVAIEC